MLQLLKVSPGKAIEFPPVLFVSQTAHITLENVTSSSVGFKIKTTAPKNYLVRPSTGVVEPHASLKVQIILQPLKTEPESGVDRFSIQATALDGDAQSLEKDQWKSVDKAKIQDHRLTVVFTEPTSGDAGAASATSPVEGAFGEEKGGPPVPTRAPVDPSELKSKYDELIKYAVAVEKQKTALLKEVEALKQSVASSSGGKSDSSQGIATHSGFEVWHVVAIVIVVVIIVKMVKFI